MINIDFLVAGCYTRCRHCYVNGGPGPGMSAADAVTCLERLDALAEYLPGEVSFTLDHEPMSHLEIHRILQAASQTRHIQNYHHGMTTGVGLMHRKDRDAVVKTYLDCGYDVFGITIHGNKAHHDEIVRRAGAYDAAIETAGFLKEMGARVEVSLMLNRFFPADAQAITHMLERLQPHWVGLAMPIFTPHHNCMDFEPYRATLTDVKALWEVLPLWRQNREEVLQRAEEHTVDTGIKRLAGNPDLKRLFAMPQEELYLTLHPDCRLYVGNSGAETRCLGDLRSLDLEATAQIIRELPGNRDYGAFYDPDTLPATETLLDALEHLHGELVYGDFESILYRGLAELGTATRILKLERKDQ